MFKLPCIYQSTSTCSTSHHLAPLQPQEKIHVTVLHEKSLTVQLEFYFPAKVWSHSATVTFLNGLTNLNPGATIFKTATGVWREEVEDVNIYRTIILNNGEKIYKDEEKFLKAVKSKLEYAIGEMMTGWAEWKETLQNAFLYTIQTVISSLSYFDQINKQQIEQSYDKGIEHDKGIEQFRVRTICVGNGVRPK